MQLSRGKMAGRYGVLSISQVVPVARRAELAVEESRRKDAVENTKVVFSKRITDVIGLHRQWTGRHGDGQCCCCFCCGKSYLMCSQEFAENFVECSVQVCEFQ